MGNANGKAIVDASNYITSQHNKLSQWLHESLCVMFVKAGGRCITLIGPLEEDQSVIPVELYWPEGQPTVFERLEQVKKTFLTAQTPDGIISGAQGLLTKANDIEIVKSVTDGIDVNGRAVSKHTRMTSDMVESELDGNTAQQAKVDTSRLIIGSKKNVHLAEAQDKMGAAEGKVDVVKEMGKVKRKVDAVEGKVDAVEGKVDVVKDEVGAVVVKVDAVKDKVDVVVGKVDAVVGKVDAVKNEVDAVLGKVDAVEGKVDAVEGKLDAVEGKVGHVQAEMKEVKDMMSKLFGMMMDKFSEE